MQSTFQRNVSGLLQTVGKPLDVVWFDDARAKRCMDRLGRKVHARSGLQRRRHVL